MARVIHTALKDADIYGKGNPYSVKRCGHMARVIRTVLKDADIYGKGNLYSVKRCGHLWQG